MQSRTLHMILCSLFFASACADIESTSEQNHAIVGGAVTAGFSATALIEIVLPTDDGSEPDTDDPSVCSGVWFDSTNDATPNALVLTAASCIWPNFEAETDDLDVTAPGFSGLTVYFGQDNTGTAYSVANVIPHRYYDGETRREDDIAMIELVGQPSVGSPAPLATAPLNVALDSDIVTLVGYGSKTATDRRDWGIKQAVEATVTLIEDDFIEAGVAERTTCRGDSGGPVYQNIGGVEQVIAINGRHTGNDAACTPTVDRLRVDKYFAEFIGPYVACSVDNDASCEACDYDGTCAEDCPVRDWDCELGMFAGDACTVNSDCEEMGNCIAAEDDETFTYCSTGCDPVLATNACPSGMLCEDNGAGVNECVWGAPSPGSQGFACGVDNSLCRSGVCEDLICVNECDIADPRTCEAPFVCGQSKVDSSKTVCLGEDLSGGGGFCNASASKSSRKTAVWMSLFVVMLLFVMRRRK